MLFQIGIAMQSSIVIRKVFCVSNEKNGIILIATILLGQCLYFIYSSIQYFFGFDMLKLDYIYIRFIWTGVYIFICVIVIAMTVAMKLFVTKQTIEIDNQKTRFSKLSLINIGPLSPANENSNENLFEKKPTETISTNSNEHIKTFIMLLSSSFLLSILFNVMQKKYESYVDYNYDPLFNFLFILFNIGIVLLFQFLDFKIIVFSFISLSFIVSLICAIVETYFFAIIINCLHGSFACLLILSIIKFSSEEKIIQQMAIFGITIRIGYFLSYIAEGEIKGIACSIIGLVFAAISIGLIWFVPKSEEKKKKADNVIDVV